MRGVYQGFTTNDEGQVITGATVEVRLPGGSLATIYSVQTGGSAIANPLTVDANGYFRFYADPGLYSIAAFVGATQLADFEDVDIVDASGALSEINLKNALGI